MSFRCFCLALSAMLTCANAEAGKIKVPGDHATIQAAVNAAAAGDVIEISQGVYHENVLIDGALDLTIRAKSGHKVTIDAAGLGPTAALKIRNSGAEGISVQFSDQITIAKCKLENLGTDGIGIADSTGVLIDKCSIDGAGDQGIEIDGDGCRVRKCCIENAAVNGIRVLGNGNTIEGNRTKKAGECGIRLGNASDGCTLCLVSGNRVEKADFYALYCSVLDNDVRDSLGGLLVANGSVGHTIARNKFEKLGQRGIQYGGGACVLEKNVVIRAGYEEILLANISTSTLVRKNTLKKSTDDGLLVQSGGHVIMENRASGSGGFDLNDETAPGSNVYVANTFGTIAP
ncbi:MAG: right-handed parallel beta-helix repeat-containing protein [Planctomycetes bacterium]|nr:right-handed parallel beta-helix repeat-containing protein [Planctomycetota bacterium]